MTVNGKDIGLKQLESGMAWWFRKYAAEQTIDKARRHEAAERFALRARLGHWRTRSLPPWEWRALKR